MQFKGTKLAASALSALLAFGAFGASAPVLANEDPITQIQDESAFETELEMTEGTLPVDETLLESGKEDDSFRFVRARTFTREMSDEQENLIGTVPEAAPRNVGLWKEDRKEVTNTRIFPYYSICKLWLEFADRKGNTYDFVGSGFFISPTEILTCAHCLYDRPEEMGLGVVKRVIIEPGRDRSNTWYGKYDSKTTTISYAYPRNYETASEEGSYEMDFGLLKIQEPMDRTYFRMSTGIDGSAVHVSGYPMEAYNKSGQTAQYEDWGTRSLIAGSCIEHDTTGSGGQSGSPTMNKNNEAVGIYGYGLSNSWGDLQWGGGVRFTLGVLDFIDRSFDGKNNVEAPVYRCYNPNSGEHVYTMRADEVRNIVKAGWTYEGLAWRNAETKDAIPVYRLYNPNAGDHHYTSSTEERDTLVKYGWKNEGLIWCAPQKKSAYSNVYRLYNPSAAAGAHHFTTDKNEYDQLVRLGWKPENIAFSAR